MVPSMDPRDGQFQRKVSAADENAGSHQLFLNSSKTPPQLFTKKLFPTTLSTTLLDFSLFFSPEIGDDQPQLAVGAPAANTTLLRLPMARAQTRAGHGQDFTRPRSLGLPAEPDSGGSRRHQVLSHTLTHRDTRTYE